MRAVPVGKVKWYDKERGFGFVSNPGDEDVYIGHAVLPSGVDELFAGQRVEYDYADGRPGPQVLHVEELGPAPQRRRHGGGGGKRHSPGELNSMISDMITMLESTVQRDLGAGRFPDRRSGRQMAEVLRAVARELDR